MKIGDLVRNLNSESGLLGIVVGWKNFNGEAQRQPIVSWADSRVNWIMRNMMEVI